MPPLLACPLRSSLVANQMGDGLPALSPHTGEFVGDSSCVASVLRLQELINFMWEYVSPESRKKHHPFIVWHWWFTVFVFDFIGDNWFFVVTLVLRQAELGQNLGSAAGAAAMAAVGGVSIAVLLVVLYMRLFRLRPLMVRLKWVYQKALAGCTTASRVGCWQTSGFKGGCRIDH